MNKRLPPYPPPSGYPPGMRRYCIDCQYRLDEVQSNQCPECGRPFGPGDPRTFQIHPGTKLPFEVWFIFASQVLFMIMSCAGVSINRELFKTMPSTPIEFVMWMLVPMQLIAIGYGLYLAMTKTDDVAPKRQSVMLMITLSPIFTTVWLICHIFMAPF